jgi:hypothetical protein
MPEKIGKYEVLERIGRGGMGMIFKARDPILDRLVALKVISTDVEITDELRARFFREAQACARMSHPNIVTVYDMGELEGRLYIVMELLEGEELKRLVAQRKALPLEDKLSIMMQVCDGLHYAHQKGIVHRDIKPGNIFVLHSGQVKILDFGIAQIANTEGGLTRTGLIMGTLRYISPEQVRGRVDHRSDIYSVGAVFFELLAMRPPFTGDDPMHLLEQLRTEEPPPLEQLDPTIPAELAATVARALRKDPSERFSDLEQMRFHLEEVQRRLSDEAQRLGARVRDQRGQLLQLRAALAERLGTAGDEKALPVITDRVRLATMQALERDFAGQIEALRSEITRADALAPVLERATLLLEAGEWADAIEEFEAIVAEIPAHARALDGLRRARAEVEAERRRQLAQKLLDDARSALADGGHTLCLEILKQAAEIPAPAETVARIASLRETAEAQLAAREAARRARQEAEGARAAMTEARRTALAQAEPRYAAALWEEAEARGAEAARLLAREAYAEARQAFEAAAARYRRFEETAREAERQEREAAGLARERALEGRQHALAEGAPQYARELWDTAEAKAREAGSAIDRAAMVEAGALFDEVRALYGGAVDAAREARRREVEGAEQARRRAEEARERARTAEAPGYDREGWGAAEGKLRDAAAALARGAHAEAERAFGHATAAYVALEDVAREARRRAREEAERAREQMQEARRAAGGQGAPEWAAGLWADAGEKATTAETVLGREAYGEAREAFLAAADVYGQAGAAAREARRRAREEAERAREQMQEARRLADGQGAPEWAAGLWTDAGERAAVAETALGREAYAEAQETFRSAAGAYGQAGEAARQAKRQAREEAERARGLMEEARMEAEAEGGPSYAGALWAEAEMGATAATDALAREAFIEAHEAFASVAGMYARAREGAREARAREQAEQARARAIRGRERAQAARAPRYATERWEAAEAKLAQAEAAIAPTPGGAAHLFDEAAPLYARAEEASLEASEAERRRAEEAVARAAQGRGEAAEADAERHGLSSWTEAEAKLAGARAALAREQHAEAAEMLDAAAVLYQQAQHEAIAIRRRRRDLAEEARQAMAEQRQSARAADAASHALSDWNAAETGAASGEAAFARDAHDEAVTAFRESAALYRRAEARARAVVRAREVARAEAERSREAAATARRAAAEAQAAAYASEPWHAGESAEARAGEALNGQQFAAARSLFTEARRQYLAAALAAGVAVEAESRRVDAMVSDARRLLESGEVAACLRRLTEVLTLRPGHAAAERLRLDAEGEQRQAMVAAERVEAPAGLEPDIVRSETTAELPATLISTPGVRPEATAEPADAPTVVIEATVLADAPTVLANVPAAEARVEPRPPALMEERDEPGPRPVPRAPRSRARLGAGMALVGVLAAIGLGAFLWLPRTPSPDPPPASPPGPVAKAPPAPPPGPAVVNPPAPDPLRALTEDLQKRATAARQEAERVDAGRLAPAEFAAAGDKAREADALLGREDWTAAQQRYRESIDAYGLARSEAGRAALPPPAPADAGKVARVEPDAARAAASAEADVRAARSRVAEVRRAADQAGAPTRERALWARAGSSQGKAEDAAKQREFERALALFGEAEKSYRAAERGAAERVRAELKRDLQEAEQARAQAAGARQEAEKAAAPSQAGALFASARQKESEGDAALNRQDPASARLRYQEAVQAYGGAQQEAQRVTAQRQQAEAQRAEAQRAEAQRAEAQQARDRMTAARRAAEQAEAPQYAPRLLAAAQAKERDGQAALGRSDHGQASRLFNDAQADYQGAAREAEAGRKHVVAIRATADQSRSRMLSRREEAEKADAARLAREIFDAAQAKQAEADGLMSRQNFVPASTTYQDAAERYMEAALRARAVHEARSHADSARARMLVEKKNASPAAAEFTSAVAEERQGNALYERLAYREAAERFKSAEALFARAVVKAAPEPPPAPRAEPPPALAPPKPRPRPLPPSF